MEPNRPSSPSAGRFSTAVRRPEPGSYGPNVRPGALRLGVVAGTTTLVLVATGCGHSAPPVALPSPTPSPGSYSASASPATPRDAVIAAYTAFFPAVGQALQSPPERVRTILENNASGGYLDFEIRQLMDHQARHLEPWGRAVIHVTKVELHSDTAKVHDCQDASHAGLAEARTHRLISQSRGNAHRNLIADLTLGSDGRWRLTDLKQYSAPCHAT